MDRKGFPRLYDLRDHVTPSRAQMVLGGGMGFSSLGKRGTDTDFANAAKYMSVPVLRCSAAR